MTKPERIRHEEYEEQQRKYKEAIPELTKNGLKKGNAILDESITKLGLNVCPLDWMMTIKEWN